MGQILLPTDFSDNSLNAGFYAMELANEFHSKITLLNIFHIPNLLPTLPVEILITQDELKDDTNSSLKTERNKLIEAKPFGVEIECISKNGFTEKEINATALSLDVELIIMGMKGKGFINNVIYGNVSTSVIDKTTKPLLLVPSKTTFRKPLNILIASDGNELKNKEGIGLLDKLKNIFNPTIHIVNIKHKNEIYNKDEISSRISSGIGNASHTIDIVESDNVNEEIMHFISSNNIDMLVMFPHHHSLLSRLFIQKHSNVLAKQAEIPVLFIPER